jgi:hypothetical protein
MKSRVFMVLLAMVFCVVFITNCTAKEYELRIQCAYPENAYVGETTKFIKERVEALTNGNVKLKIFWPDQLVKTNEAFDALKKELIDGYTGSLLYFAGSIPEVNCEWLPFGWMTPEEAEEVYLKYGWLELLRKATERHGAFYVSPISVASMGLLTKFPVNKLEDLKGKKIRAVGMEAMIVKALGAAPGDELRLGFGQDEAVAVERRLDTSYRSQEGIFDTYRRLERHYVMRVRNGHGVAVEIELLDRIPVPQDERIRVELTSETTPPDQRDVDGRRGVLAWRGRFAPGEEREIRLGFAVIVPDGLELDGFEPGR